MQRQILAILGGKPVLKKPFPSYNSLGSEETRAVNAVMRTGVLSGFLGRAGDKFNGGPYVRQLERSMSRIFRVKYAVSFNSATTALQAAVASLGIGPGDEVITSPFTMSATATAILLNNAVPVFADVDEKSYTLDPRSVEKCITAKTKAIIVVNIFGGSADFHRLSAVARKHNLKIIEDNAQAIGARYHGKHLGTIGDIGVFSFNVHKHLQCGEGGVLVTADKKIAFRAQLIRNHGEAVIDDLNFSEKIYEPIAGSNYRLSELHAAIAIEQLKKMRQLLDPQIKLAQYLTRKLKQFPWLQAVQVLPGTTHVYYMYPFKFFSEKIGFGRQTFAQAMAAEGFQLNEGYMRPLYFAPLYQHKRMYPGTQFPFISKEFPHVVSYKKGICPVAERLYAKDLLLTTVFQRARGKQDIDLFIRAIAKIQTHRKDLMSYEKSL